MRQKLIKIALLTISLRAFLLISPGALYAEDVRIAIIDSGAKGYVNSAKSFTEYKAMEDRLIMEPRSPA